MLHRDAPRSLQQLKATSEAHKTQIAGEKLASLRCRRFTVNMNACCADSLIQIRRSNRKLRKDMSFLCSAYCTPHSKQDDDDTSSSRKLLHMKKMMTLLQFRKSHISPIL